MYEYQAKVLRVVDGDTLHLDVDLGVDVHTRMTVRLRGVDCPERRGVTRDAGEAARVFAHTWIVENYPVVLLTFKDRKEKYGRYLGEIYANGRSLTEDLVDAGHAVRWEE
jgi:micrococcal nuclease